jgi:transposase
MLCGTWREQVGSGASCRTICRLGTWCISRCSAGSGRVVSSCWSRTCGSLLREWGGRKSQPTAVVVDSRTLQSTPESGPRAGYDGAKRRKGSKVHIAVDTLAHLLALTVTPADQGDREQVAALAQEVQQVTGGTVELAYVDQGYTGPTAAQAAQQHGLRLEVVKHPMAKRGFVLLPRRWVVERSFAWAARFRRLARDYERLDTTLKGLHLLAFATLMLRNLADTLK